MQRRTFVLSMMAFLTSCATPVPMPRTTAPAYPPKQATVTSPHAEALTYRKATTVFAKEPGWVIVMTQPTTVFRGIVHQAAELTVVLEPAGHGTLVTIHGEVLHNKIVTGAFTEVDDYAQRLREAL